MRMKNLETALHLTILTAIVLLMLIFIFFSASLSNNILLAFAAGFLVTSFAASVILFREVTGIIAMLFAFSFVIIFISIRNLDHSLFLASAIVSLVVAINILKH